MKTPTEDSCFQQLQAVVEELAKHISVPVSIPLHIRIRMLANRERAIIHTQKTEIYSLQHRCTYAEASAALAKCEGEIT